MKNQKEYKVKEIDCLKYKLKGLKNFKVLAYMININNKGDNYRIDPYLMDLLL
jgi:hypothetical protein